MTVMEVLEKYQRILMLPLYDGEDWRVVKDFPNYIVTSFGRVFNTKTGRELNPCRAHANWANRKNSNYYRYWVRLYDNTKYKNYYIHTLVANAFLDKPDCDDLVINHKNHDTSDNRVENLEWITRIDNCSDKLNCNSWINYSLEELIELRSKEIYGSKKYWQLNGVITHRRKKLKNNV